jgi:hypothetical protein
MNKYKVIATGLQGCEVGDIVELTDQQAAARVNKVELIESAPAKPVKEAVKAPESAPESEAPKTKAKPKAKRKRSKGSK